ncbi:MAG: hypothetical protein FJ291_12205 [Planctomycetes bacterium]|nr:hypothetical protein [Planctomycetota bacterium]
MKDPIVEEVRKRRMEHTARFHGDLDAICDDFLRIEQTLGDRVVRLPAVRLKPKKQPTASS